MFIINKYGRCNSIVMLRRERDVSIYWLEFFGGYCYIFDIGVFYFSFIIIIWFYVRYYMNFVMDLIIIYCNSFNFVDF